MYYPLSREIYGGEPWMVDRATFTAMFNTLKDFRNGVTQAPAGDKLNSAFVYDLQNATKIVTRPGQLNYNEDNHSLIYVINLNGAITKNGGESSYGTKDLSNMIARFDADKNVIGGIILTDSGGGSTSGMEYMAHAMQQAKKPIVGLVEHSGVAASAAYGILSNTDWIMSESAENTVGSIGTMISFAAQPKKTVDSDGFKSITIYASASTKKNLAFEEAINNDNYDLIISELLDPVNERFMAMIKSNRPNVLGSQLDGSVYNAGDVLGTLVDEIGDFNAAVAKVKSLSSGQGIRQQIDTNKKSTNNKAMTAQQLLAEHPAVHAEIFGAGRAAGVSAEKDRTGVWLAHLETDPEAVAKGIKSGEEISATAREELLIKGSLKNRLADVKGENAKPTPTPESATEEPEKTDVQNLFANAKKLVNLN